MLIGLPRRCFLDHIFHILTSQIFKDRSRYATYKVDSFSSYSIGIESLDSFFLGILLCGTDSQRNAFLITYSLFPRVRSSKKRVAMPRTLSTYSFHIPLLKMFLDSFFLSILLCGTDSRRNAFLIIYFLFPRVRSSKIGDAMPPTLSIHCLHIPLVNSKFLDSFFLRIFYGKQSL